MKSIETRQDRSIARGIDLTSLQLFACVCELGSIGKAAEREFIAASALSKRLSDLEAALGTTLLYRHSRGVDPTPAGQSLLHHARSVLFGLEKMQAEMSEFADGVRGHVRIYANISAIVQFLPEDLGKFARLHEHIKVDLEEHVSMDVVRGVTEGAADLGICNSANGVGDLQTLPYRRDRLVLVCPRGHPLTRQVGLADNFERNQHLVGDSIGLSAINFEDTLGFDHVGLHTNSTIHLAIRRAAASAGRPIKLRIHVTGLDAMCRMIHNGLGVGVIPHRAFELMRHLGDLIAVPLLDAWAERRIDLIARDFSSLPSTTRILVEHLTRAPPHTTLAS